MAPNSIRVWSRTVSLNPIGGRRKAGWMPSNREALANGIAEAADAAHALTQTFEGFTSRLREFHDRLDGLDHLEDLYRDLDRAKERDAALGAIAVFEQAFLRARILTYRSLHEDEGLTFTEMARLTGRSRQWVTRTYYDKRN